ncbi:uncharacterized protein [Ambystoma mexicanum]|uniref:uncharacterized protein n=1 Tax=Ambystoma mexicanum TaxID=8296 RepID=UPI0037E92A14
MDQVKSDSWDLSAGHCEGPVDWVKIEVGEETTAENQEDTMRYVKTEGGEEPLTKSPQGSTNLVKIQVWEGSSPRDHEDLTDQGKAERDQPSAPYHPDAVEWVKIEVGTEPSAQDHQDWCHPVKIEREELSTYYRENPVNELNTKDWEETSHTKYPDFLKVMPLEDVVKQPFANEHEDPGKGGKIEGSASASRAITETKGMEMNMG